MAESYKEIENCISEANEAYYATGKPKIKPLAREFNVPYHRLLSRINGGDSRSTRRTTNKALDEAQEQALIQWITFLDNANASPTPTMIQQCANRMSGQAVSKMWVD